MLIVLSVGRRSPEQDVDPLPTKDTDMSCLDSYSHLTSDTCSPLASLRSEGRQHDDITRLRWLQHVASFLVVIVSIHVSSHLPFFLTLGIRERQNWRRIIRGKIVTTLRYCWWPTASWLDSRSLHLCSIMDDEKIKLWVLFVFLSSLFSLCVAVERRCLMIEKAKKSTRNR